MASEDDRRRFLYLAYCIPVRILITSILIVAAWKKMKHLQRLAAVLSIIGGVGFIYRFLTWDADQRGGAGGKVWWNRARPVHALLFWSYAIAVFSGNEHVAPLFFVFDTLIGILLIPTQRRLTST